MSHCNTGLELWSCTARLRLSHTLPRCLPMPGMPGSRGCNLSHTLPHWHAHTAWHTRPGIHTLFFGPLTHPVPLPRPVHCLVQSERLARPLQAEWDWPLLLVCVSYLACARQAGDLSCWRATDCDHAHCTHLRTDKDMVPRRLLLHSLDICGSLSAACMSKVFAHREHASTKHWTSRGLYCTTLHVDLHSPSMVGRDVGLSNRITGPLSHIRSNPPMWRSNLPGSRLFSKSTMSRTSYTHIYTHTNTGTHALPCREM